MVKMVFSRSGLAHLAAVNGEGEVVGTACAQTKLPKGARIGEGAGNSNCHRCSTRNVIR